MSGRRLHGFANSVSFETLFPAERADSRWRRTLAATICGFALFGFAAVLAYPHGAEADWRPSGLFQIFSGYRTEIVEPSPTFMELPSPEPARKHKAKRAPISQQTVCVRLCDGYFFPAPASGEPGCASLCPGAPTALYSLTAGSDRIEDAVSKSGARYSALPAALSYRTTFDNACGCRPVADNEAQLMRDPTLRKGDAVMTLRGMLVYRGGDGEQHRARDFSTLAQAKLPPQRRAELVAMEQVSLGPDRMAMRLAAIAPVVAKRQEDQIRLVERSGSGVN